MMNDDDDSRICACRSMDIEIDAYGELKSLKEGKKEAGRQRIL